MLEEWLALNLAYNFQGNFKNSRWALGGNLGWQQQGIRGELLRTPGGIYEGPTLVHNDNRLLTNNWQNAWLTMGFGAFWQAEQYAPTAFLFVFCLSLLPGQELAVAAFAFAEKRFGFPAARSRFHLGVARQYFRRGGVKRLRSIEPGCHRLVGGLSLQRTMALGLFL